MKPSEEIEVRIPRALMRIADLGILLDAAPVNKFPACWEHQIDERWWIALNGHREDRMTSAGEIVHAFSVYVKYNGWPAGIITAGGGIIAAGSCANEDTFIAALDAAIAREIEKAR